MFSTQWPEVASARDQLVGLRVPVDKVTSRKKRKLPTLSRPLFQSPRVYLFLDAPLGIVIMVAVARTARRIGLSLSACPAQLPSRSLAQVGRRDG